MIGSERKRSRDNPVSVSPRQDCRGHLKRPLCPSFVGLCRSAVNRRENQGTGVNRTNLSAVSILILIVINFIGEVMIRLRVRLGIRLRRLFLIFFCLSQTSQTCQTCRTKIIGANRGLNPLSKKKLSVFNTHYTGYRSKPFWAF